MANESLPRQNSDISNGKNFSPTWYNFFRRLADRITAVENAPVVSSSNSVTNIYGYTGLEPTIQDASTARVLTIDDSLVNIESTNASGLAVTVNKDVLPENSITYFTQGAAGQVVITAGVGVTIEYTDTLKTRTQESMIGLKQIQVNKFELFGDTEPSAPALTVLARSVNSTGAPAFLSAASNGTVLRRIGDALGFSNVLASEVTNTPAGSISAVTVQAALAELDAEKQPLDTQLTTIAGLSLAGNAGKAVIVNAGSTDFELGTVSGGVTNGDKGEITVSGDASFASVSSLLHFNGTDASATFTDVTGKTWTAVGNAQIDTAFSKYGGAAGLFDGTGDYLTTATSSDFTFGTGDFTVEMWFYVNASTAAWSRACEFQTFNSDGGGHLSFNGSDSAGLRRLGWQQGKSGGGGDRLDSNSAFPTGVWTHYAVSRQGNTTRAFVGGVLQSATITASGRAQDNFTNNAFIIAADLTFANNYFGSIDDLRVTKGVARYTATFTPPASQFEDYLSNWAVDNDVVTFAKMQNIATAKLLGRGTAGSGDVEEITLGTNLSFAGTTLNATGGGSVANGTTTIDFGNFPGLNEITATITGQATIVSGSKVTAWLSPLVTSNHTVEDHLFALNIINVTAGNIVAATGFTIYARSMDKLQGVYNLNWMWV